jgi:hypothetical protein
VGLGDVVSDPVVYPHHSGWAQKQDPCDVADVVAQFRVLVTLNKKSYKRALFIFASLAMALYLVVSLEPFQTVVRSDFFFSSKGACYYAY